METRMKKIISVVSAVSVMISFTSAFATNEGDDMRKALESVKSRVDIPEEYSEFSSRENYRDGYSQYYFTWNNKEDYRSINVTCTNDGIITSYSNYEDGYHQKPGMSDMSVEEAESIAEEYVKNINPDYPYRIEIDSDVQAELYSDFIHFPIHIYINDIVMENDGGYVTVNSETGNVTSFNIWYIPDAIEDFASSVEFISAGEAKEAYSKNLGMELVYRSYYDDNKEIFFPVYTQKAPYSTYINALTGDIEEIGYYATSRGAEDDLFSTQDTATASKDSGLSPQEISEIENINGLISKADIEKQIKENRILSVPSSLNADYISLFKNNTDEEYYYSISMSSEDDSVYVSANAKTGEIQNYSRYSKDIADDAADNENDDVFKNLAGSKANEYKYNADRKRYERFVNGIRVEDDTATVTCKGNILINYSINYSNADFPSIENAMSKDEAEKSFFDQTEYRTSCISSYKDNEVHIVPVYIHDNVSVNPFSGKAVNWRNEELTSNENGRLEYSDIDGHYARQYIDALARYGVGFEGGEFKPDEKITQKDLITLLTSVYNGESIIVMFSNKQQSDLAYSRAFSGEIISEDERDDDAVITRETASIYMIRAMDAEAYAQYDDIYVTPFNDVTENKGYIALLSAMGVVNGDGDNMFNPKREITRAEFAVMLYNSLNV